MLVGAVRKAAESREAVNLAQLLNVCTVNALGRVMMGRRVFGDGSGGGDPKADEFKSMVVEVMVLAGVFNIGDFIPALDCLDLQGVAAKMKKLHSRFDAFLGGILEEHKINGRGARGSRHTDMLSTLISLQQEDADVDGGRLTDTEIKALLLVRRTYFSLCFIFYLFFFSGKNQKIIRVLPKVYFCLSSMASFFFFFFFDKLTLGSFLFLLWIW